MSDGILTCSSVVPPLADGSLRPFAPAWRTETVRAVAKGIDADAAFDRLPVLADALEDAGCDDPLLLAHCRQGERHRPGCWVVNLILRPALTLDPWPHFTTPGDPPPYRSLDELFRDYQRTEQRRLRRDVRALQVVCGVTLLGLFVYVLWLLAPLLRPLTRP